MCECFFFFSFVYICDLCAYNAHLHCMVDLRKKKTHSSSRRKKQKINNKVYFVCLFSRRYIYSIKLSIFIWCTKAIWIHVQCVRFDMFFVSFQLVSRSTRLFILFFIHECTLRRVSVSIFCVIMLAIQIYTSTPNNIGIFACIFVSVRAKRRFFFSTLHSYSFSPNDYILRYNIQTLRVVTHPHL